MISKQTKKILETKGTLDKWARSMGYNGMVAFEKFFGKDDVHTMTQEFTFYELLEMIGLLMQEFPERKARNRYGAYILVDLAHMMVGANDHEEFRHIISEINPK